MAIINTPLLGLPYAGADTDETYAVLAGLFVKDGKKLTLPEIVEKYTPTAGTVHIKAADWTAADGTEDAYDAKIKINGVEAQSVILIYPLSSADTEKAKRLGIRAKTLSGSANDDTFVIVRATGGAPTVADGISLVYIAFRGYPVWNEGLTPPAMPYATVIGVDPYIATEEGDRDDIAASQRLVTEAVTALRSSLSSLSTGLADTNKALELRLKSADLQTKLDEYRAAKGLIDKTVSDLLYYYNKSQTLTKEEINALVSAIPKFKNEVVTSLPTSNISDTTVYLVKSGDDDTNLYTEYIRTGGKWEKLGTQTVDLTGYATEAWVNDILASYVKTVDMEAYVTGLLAGYLNKEDAAKTYQLVGDYLTTDTGDQRYAKPADIPTKTSQLTNDSGYITKTEADGKYAKPSDIPTVPQTLPNPYALTILGKTYTGGKAVSLTAEELMEAIKTASGGVVAYLDGNRLVLSGNLPDATYTAYYEVDGELVEIGDLTLGSVTPDPVTYTIRWVNYNGEVLKTVTVAEGDSEPEYDGPTPTRAENGQYTYTFKGWDKTVDDATGDVTYTATYTQTAKPVEPTYTNILTSGAYTVNLNKRWSGSSKGFVDCDGMIGLKVPIADVVNKTIWFSGFTANGKSSDQPPLWMSVKEDGTKVGALGGTTSGTGNVWTSTHLVDKGNGVYSIAINTTTMASVATAQYLVIAMNVNTSAALTEIPDTCIITIGESILRKAVTV